MNFHHQCPRLIGTVQTVLITMWFQIVLMWGILLKSLFVLVFLIPVPNDDILTLSKFYPKKFYEFANKEICYCSLRRRSRWVIWGGTLQGQRKTDFQFSINFKQETFLNVSKLNIPLNKIQYIPSFKTKTKNMLNKKSTE